MRPSRPSTASETGAPTMIAIGAAIMKSAPVRARSAAGIQYVVVNLATHDDVETIELLAERVLPALQGFADPG